MDFNPIMLSVPLFFVLIGIELLYDRIKQSRLYRLNDSITNLNMGTTDQTVGIMLGVLIPLTMYELVYHNFALFRIEANWLTYIILFLAYDFCYYWGHRMSHEINLFWSAHVVHHQSEDMNLGVALRQSWFQGFFTAPFYLPLALIGFDTTMLVWVGAINLTYQFWVHTELITKMGIFEWVMNTPSHHRVHHGRNPKYIDKNHAGVFIVWDRMFGTFQQEEERPTYGITTPINSWNPVWANFSHFEIIGKHLKEAKTWKDKLKVLFYKPGWSAKLQAYLPIPEVSRDSIAKFNTQSSQLTNYYAFFQYLLITIGALVFIINQSKISGLNQLICGALIIWAVLNNGAVFERKRWFLILEFLRLLTTFALIGCLIKDSVYLNNFIIAAVVILLISFVWLYFIRNFFLKKDKEISLQNA